MDQKPAFLRLGLTGWPLGHSISPRLHTAALDALGLKGTYSLYPVPPLPEGTAALRELLEQMLQGELHGLNVTIPHKQAVIPLLEEKDSSTSTLTPAARAIGAVNTIVQRNGHLLGDNTDAPGFLADLERIFPGASSTASTHQQALVFGAGGAARAVVYALARAGWSISIAARRPAQAQELASSLCVSANVVPLPCARHPAQDAADQFQSLLPVSLIVNTTPLGMYPKIQESPWPTGVPFPPQAVLYDLVYNPAETSLVRAARSAGLKAETGLGMLIEQAALAFEIWSGFSLPREIMWKAALSLQENL